MLYKHFYNYTVNLFFNLILFGIVGLILYGMISEATKQVLHLQQTTLSSMSTDRILESETVYGKLVEAGVHYPEYAYWQFYHESNKFRSSIFKDCNNGCGMKVPSIRKFWGTGHCRGHARYPTFDHNILDYKEYQEYVGISKMKFSSLKEYLQVMQRFNYAEDKYYVENILRLYEKDKELPYK